MCYVYILECSDKTLYTGWTNNLKNRLEAHLKGNGAKYTRTRLPVKLVYFEHHHDKKSAQKRERYIKKMSRSQKLRLIHNFNIHPR
ncbi:MAG: GIY-YIG nuclease family protein [Tepidanaerobacteraceae bacterium]